MSEKKAIVIGSGVAGMAVAIRLATDGWSTEVFEKNSYPGGKLTFFEQDGYRFDAGPSLFTQPTHLEELFAYAGESIQDYFHYQKVDVSCRYFYENGKCITAYGDRQKLAAELNEKLQENPANVLNYLDRSEKLYHDVGNIFLNHSLHKKDTWFRKHTLKAMGTVGASDLFGSLHESNKKHFRSEEAVQLFNRYATYNGSNPYQAPGMLRMIPHLEMNEGTFYPRGGMISITNALYELARKKGVKFHFNSPVEEIAVSHKKVCGVVVSGQKVFADIVVSNGDVYHTYRHLLKNTSQSAQIAKTERSSSALIFYWGMKKEYAGLGLHNIFFSQSYKEEFDCIFKQKTLHNDPTVYINITSKMEKEHAAEGGENWFVMINAPVQEGQNWPELIQAAKKNILDKLRRMLDAEVENHIASESILDPGKIGNNTLTYKGALYGTSSNSKWSAFLRPANFSTEYNGLYFCGGTVHPGGGIPLCLKSAQITSSIIRKDRAETDV